MPGLKFKIRIRCLLNTRNELEFYSDKPTDTRFLEHEMVFAHKPADCSTTCIIIEHE